MISIVAIVKSKYGVHVRPSAAIVKKAKEFPGTKIVIIDPESTMSADALDLLGILNLSLSYSTRVIIRAVGIEEEKVAKEIATIIETFEIPKV